VVLLHRERRVVRASAVPKPGLNARGEVPDADARGWFDDEP
jgi:hypothetical protein